MAFFHGARSSEVPTSLLSPIEVDSAITVAWGTAPVHLANNPAKANEPVLCYELAEYVNKFGDSDDFDKYTLAEVASSQFQLFRVAPTIFINVLDPDKHYNECEITSAASLNNPVELNTPMLLDTLKITSDGVETLTLTENVEYEITTDTTTSDTTISILADVTLPADSIAIEYTQTDSTVVSTNISVAALPYILPVGATGLSITCDKPFTNILVRDEDFTAKYNSSNKVVITFLDDAKIIDESVTIAWHEIDATQVTSADIIGGVDSSGNSTGIELVEKIYPKFRVVPSILIAPKYSTAPEVAAALKAKCTQINGIFNAVAVVDLPATLSYTDAPEWKNQKNLVDTSLIVCYPKVSLGGVQYHLSTQLASLMAVVDHDNDDVPYVSPSNKNLQMDSSVLADGSEQLLSLTQANYLNSQGIVTALNFSQGWVAWGNRNSLYPSSADVKDNFINIRRFFYWLSNSVITTYFSRVDYPLNRRLLETITDSINIWLNGLTAKGALLGGRCEVLGTENPTTDLMNGIIKFHLFITPPSPAEELSFILEYDPNYIADLIG